VLLFTGWVRLRNTVVPVRTEQVTRQDIASVISTNGKVEPVKNFAAYAPAPATVKRVLVHEGDYVNRSLPRRAISKKPRQSAMMRNAILTLFSGCNRTVRLLRPKWKRRAIG
jgi:hypothetical protein